MNFMLDIQIRSPEPRMNYKDNVFVIGSCFTEHIGGRLDQLKFSILQNPNGILFDALSVCKSIVSYIDHKEYSKADLFQLNELWQSWQHHSHFSGLDEETVLKNINQSQRAANAFLKKADWLIITLGSSFSYQLTETNESVANCHRAPSKWFNKHLVGIDEMLAAFRQCITRLVEFNPSLKIIFTVSPVRHIRDGVMENNRSKARLIEVVHQLTSESRNMYYFPAYELVIDVLRDYRFYDIDLVHPNYAATEFVFEKFTEYYMGKEDLLLIEEIRDILKAYKHKPFQPSSQAHLNFIKAYLVKVLQFQQKHPYIDLSMELAYFSEQAKNVNN